MDKEIDVDLEIIKEDANVLSDKEVIAETVNIN